MFLTLRKSLLTYLPAVLVAMCITSTSYAQTLVLGQLSDRPKKDYKQLRPMVDYAAKQLSEFGIESSEVKLFNDIESLITALQQGDVDWVTETAYSAAILKHEANAIALLEKHKSGQQRYHALVFVKADSPYLSLADLKGKRLAFEHINSFSSYFMPRMMLEEAGVDINHIARFNSPLDPDKVNYLFSRNEKNNALWVQKGLVEAGVLNDGDWNNPGRLSDDVRQSLRIIAQSKPYPRAFELVSPSMPEAMQAALKQVLLSLNQHDSDQLMQRYEKTSGFAEVQPDSLQALDEIYQYHQRWSTP